MKFIQKPFSELSTDELYTILQLRSEIFVVEQNCVYNDLDGLDRKGEHLYCQIEGEIVAYVRILKPGSRFPYASIGRVVTHSSFRKRGISRAIMQKAIEFIHNEWNLMEIKISAQKYLREFYESLGFTVVTNEYLEDGIPHYGMLLKKAD